MGPARTWRDDDEEGEGWKRGRPDEYQSDDDDAEGVDDFDADAEVDEAPCPHCRETIHGDAVRCPFCGEYVNDAAAPNYKPWWVAVGLILALGMMLLPYLWLLPR